jgi:hypothetical protein
VLRLTVTLSDFVNYFAPLSHGERTPVTRDQVWSGLRGHRRLARAARKQLVERQIAEDAQVEQDESLTRNIGPWTHLHTDKLVTEDDYFKLFPGLSHVTEIKWKHLTGTYQKRDVHWSTKLHWAYSNHREVDFSESEESDQATDPDSETAEVSQLIESVTQAVASLSSKLS